MNFSKSMISLAFVLIGIILIGYAMSRPCEVGDITQTVGDQTITVEQPIKMNKMVCLSADMWSLVPLLLGTAAIFPGVSGLHKGLTE